MLLAPGGVRSEEAEHPVGPGGVTGPDLGTIDDVVIAITVRPALQRGEVRSRIRFRVPLAENDVAVGETGQKPLLLIFRTELDQCRTHHAGRKDADVRCIVESQLPFEDILLLEGPAGTAVFDRPGRTTPAALVEDAHPATGVGGCEAGVFAPHLAPEVVGERFANERTHLFAKLLDVLAHATPRQIEGAHVRSGHTRLQAGVDPGDAGD